MADIKKQIQEKFKDVEKIEAVRGTINPKDFVESKPYYPKPLRRRFLVFESFGASIEEGYFWMKDVLGELGYVEVDKIIDTFTASEQSAFWGSAQQRMGLQQDKAATYLATIGKMVKELFQIVRDIRLLEERETLYVKAAAGDDGAEKSLKGAWIDFVDNGPQGVKASSVYGLASQLGYNTLPEIFFGAPAALKQEEITPYIKKLTYNEKVKAVAVRKLELFVAWRDATWKEITAKKKFTIQYLRQHYNSIKLYMDWVKPYLKNIKRLGMDTEIQLSADIVGAFEGSVIEIEFLAKKPGNPHQCILVTFKFRTRPIMQTGADYQKGPAHLGRMEMTVRGYTWDDNDINEYKKIKLAEDFEMLKSIDSSVEQAMEYLGDPLMEYLEAAGEEYGRKSEQDELAKSLLHSKKVSTIEEGRKKARITIEGRDQLAKALLNSGAVKTLEEGREKAKLILEGKAKKSGLLEPFTSIFTGFKELGKGFVPTKNELKQLKKEEKRIKEEKKDIAKGVTKDVALIYTLYKKAHKMITP